MKIKRFRRVVCIALSILMVMTNLVYADTAKADVAKCPDIVGNKYEVQLREWVDNGFIKGAPDGNFKPNNTITRAEFMALVNRSFGFTESAEINYSDVQKNNWFYKDAAIAAKTGYMLGSNGKLTPQDPISRQEFSVVLSRLSGNVSVVDDKVINALSDGKSIPEWSRAAISTAVGKGYFEGLIGKDFKAAEKISRLETIVALDRAFKSMYKAVYSKKGTYGPASGIQTLEGSVVIVSPEVTLKNTTINGDLILRESIGDGNVYLDNVVVKGTTIVKGGGAHSIVIRNSTLGSVIVRREGSIVRIVATGSTTIGEVNMQSGATLHEEFLTGSGFGDVVIPDDILAGATIVFEGNFDDIQIDSRNASINVGSGTIGNLTLAPEAAGTTVNLTQGASVSTLNLNAVVTIAGQGTIQTANVTVSGSTIEQQPQNVVTSPGVTVATNTPPPAPTQAPTLTQAPIPTPAPTTSGGGGGNGGGNGGGSNDDEKPVIGINEFSNITIWHKAYREITIASDPGDAVKSAVSDNASVAAVTVAGNIVKVTGVAPGTAIITVSASKSGCIASSRQFTVTVMALHTDATLSNLTVNGTTVAEFNPSTLSYTIELPDGATSVPMVAGIVTDTGLASAVVTPAASLPGATMVLVTAQDGTTKKTYTVNFEVKAILNTNSEGLDNGTITPTAGNYDVGEIVTITASPEAGYILGNVTVTNAGTPVSYTRGTNAITFTMPVGTVDVSVDFAEELAVKQLSSTRSNTVDASKNTINNFGWFGIALSSPLDLSADSEGNFAISYEYSTNGGDTWEEAKNALGTAFYKDKSWSGYLNNADVPEKVIKYPGSNYGGDIVPAGVPIISNETKVGERAANAYNAIIAANSTVKVRTVLNITDNYGNKLSPIKFDPVTFTNGVPDNVGIGIYDKAQTGEYIVIKNVNELKNAIDNQLYGQTWAILPGTYNVMRDMNILRDNDGQVVSSGGQSGWYLPIAADDLTVIGVGDPIITSSEIIANGAWASQNLITVWGDDVTFKGLTITPKVETNKSVEVVGNNNVTIEGCKFVPNAIVPGAVATKGGSLYFNGAGKNGIDKTIEVKNNTFNYTSVAFDGVENSSINITGNTYENIGVYAIGNTYWGSPERLTVDYADVNISGNNFNNVTDTTNIIAARLNQTFILDETNKINGAAIDKADFGKYINFDNLANWSVCKENKVIVDGVLYESPYKDINNLVTNEAQLAAAISEAETGDTILVAAKTYNIGKTQLLIDKGITLRGTGETRPVIIGTAYDVGSYTEPMLKTTANNSAEQQTLIENINFRWKFDDGFSAKGNGNAAMLAGNNVIVRNCDFSGMNIPATQYVPIVSIGQTGGTVGPNVEARNITFEGNTVAGTISVVRSSQGNVLNAKIANNTIDPINMEGIWTYVLSADDILTISGNTINDIPAGFAAIKLMEQVASVNDEEDYTDDAISVDNHDAGVLLQYNTRLVDSTYGGADGVNNKYKTLQAAIDAANAGDKIRVAAGTYEAPTVTGTPNIGLKEGKGFVIDKPITIVGANYKTKATADERTNESMLTSPILVKAKNVTIKGFTFDNSWIISRDAVDIDGLEILNNRFVNWNAPTLTAAIHLGYDAPDKAADDGITIMDNYIGPMTGTNKSGIYIENSKNISVTNNIIATDNFGGIQLNKNVGAADDSIVVTGNTVNDFEAVGIQIAQFHTDKSADGPHKYLGTINVSGNTLTSEEEVTQAAINITHLREYNYGYCFGNPLGVTIAPNNIDIEKGIDIVNESSAPDQSVAYATNQAELKAALENAGIATINITANFGITEEMHVTRPVTINGRDNVITVTADLGNENGSKHAIGVYAENPGMVTINDLTVNNAGKAYGINTYDEADLVLNNVEIIGSKGAGLTVNGSTVTATELKTSGNAWGGVNVDPGEDVVLPTIFILNSGTLGEGAQIWSDGKYVSEDATVNVTAEGYNKYALSLEPYVAFFWTDRELPYAAAITKGEETTYYPTVQFAIDAAKAEDTVNVAEGTFTEQLVINKDITIIGADAAEGGNTIIQAPNTLETKFTTSAANKPIIFITNAVVTLQDLVVDGAGKGNANYRIVGIGVYNAGGLIDNVEVKDIREEPLNGNQHGVGILAYNGDGDERNLTVQNCYIHDYQKNGMTLSGAGLDVIVSNNTIKGAGKTSVIAQNGIQISGGATGTVDQNVVKGNWYGGVDWSSAGILAYGDVGIEDITNNTLENNQVAIYVAGVAPAESKYYYVEPENFNTHADADYKGINVGFRLGENLNITDLKSVEVSLHRDNERLVTNTANAKFFAELEDTEKQHSTPFIVQNGSYFEEYWNLGRYDLHPDFEPSTALIKVVDMQNNSYLVENNNLDEANGITYDSLFDDDRIHVSDRWAPEGYRFEFDITDVDTEADTIYGMLYDSDRKLLPGSVLVFERDTEDEVYREVFNTILPIARYEIMLYNDETCTSYLGMGKMFISPMPHITSGNFGGRVDTDTIILEGYISNYDGSQTNSLSFSRNEGDPVDININDLGQFGIVVELEPGRNNIELSFSFDYEGLTNGDYNTGTTIIFGDEDTAAPELREAEVSGNSIVLRYNEELLRFVGESSVFPAAGNFILKVNEEVVEICDETDEDEYNDIRMGRYSIFLCASLDTLIESGDVVTISYTPGDNPIQDLAGNLAAELVDVAVVNITPEADEYEALEEDNTKACNIAVNDPDGPQTHTIAPAGDIDWLYFDVEEGDVGKTYTISTSNLLYDMDTFITLYYEEEDPNTHEIELVYIDENDDIVLGEVVESLIEFTPGVAGTYVILVRHFDEFYGAGYYDITVTSEVSDESGDLRRSMSVEPEQNDAKGPIEVDFIIESHEREPKVRE